VDAVRDIVKINNKTYKEGQEKYKIAVKVHSEPELPHIDPLRFEFTCGKPGSSLKNNMVSCDNF
jgi:hypothetical protein